MKQFTPVVKDGTVIDYSDGYHTFNELYAHRVALWIQLTKRLKDEDYYNVWRSRLHADGSSFAGWFVLGVSVIETGQQLTYHLPECEWHRCSFAEEKTHAPEFDGHTSQDVLDRINQL